MELRLGQDLMKPRSKLQPFPRGQGLQKAWFGMSPGVGSPHPGLSSSSQPSSLPNPTTTVEPLPSRSPLPGAPLSQLMTPSLQRLQRETEALDQPTSHCRAQRPRAPALRSLRGSDRHPTAASGPLCREGGCRFKESSTQLHFL